jgi:phage protein D
MLQPTFTLRIGDLSSTSDAPVGGPVSLVVERALEIAADALEIEMMERRGVALGDEVSLELGHDGSEERVFTGSVTMLRPSVAGQRVVALGRMQRLLELRTSATFEEQSAGDVARELIRQAGAEADAVDDGPVLPRFAVDVAASAYHHLRRLADRLGFALYGVRGGGIRFQALGSAAGLDAGLGGLAAAAGALLGGGEQYRRGEHLLAASATRHPAEAVRVEVGGESPSSTLGGRAAHWLTVEDRDFRGAAGDGASLRLELDGAARTKDLADRFARGRFARARDRAHTVAVRVMGRPGVELGDTLSVGGFDDPLLDASGHLRALRHRFGGRTGFTSDFWIAPGVPG